MKEVKISNSDKVKNFIERQKAKGRTIQFVRWVNEEERDMLDITLKKLRRATKKASHSVE